MRQRLIGVRCYRSAGALAARPSFRCPMRPKGPGTVMRQMGAFTPPSRTSNRPQLRVPDKIYEHTRKLGRTVLCPFTTRRSRVIPIRERAGGIRRRTPRRSMIPSVSDDPPRPVFHRTGALDGGIARQRSGESTEKRGFDTVITQSQVRGNRRCQWRAPRAGNKRWPGRFMEPGGIASRRTRP